MLGVVDDEKARGVKEEVAPYYVRLKTKDALYVTRLHDPGEHVVILEISYNDHTWVYGCHGVYVQRKSWSVVDVVHRLQRTLRPGCPPPQLEKKAYYSPVNILPSIELSMPVLILYSHGRNPPLHPPPDLKFDLRSIPNPPKALRDVSDGRSKRLREHLLAEPKFLARLKSAEEDIIAAMQTKLVEHEAPLKDNDMSGNEENEEREPEQIEQARTSDDQTAGDAPSNDVVLRVGCNCALGHHRSVAFVCELASRPWPNDWEVNVIHRDLEKKRSGGARERQKASARKKSRFFEAQLED